MKFEMAFSQFYIFVCSFRRSKRLLDTTVSAQTLIPSRNFSWMHGKMYLLNSFQHNGTKIYDRSGQKINIILMGKSRNLLGLRDSLSGCFSTPLFYNSCKFQYDAPKIVSCLTCPTLYLIAAFLYIVCADKIARKFNLSCWGVFWAPQEALSGATRAHNKGKKSSGAGNWGKKLTAACG